MRIICPSCTGTIAASLSRLRDGLPAGSEGQEAAPKTVDDRSKTLLRKNSNDPTALNGCVLLLLIFVNHDTLQLIELFLAVAAVVAVLLLFL